jgi:hypothetical protein
MTLLFHLISKSTPPLDPDGDRGSREICVTLMMICELSLFIQRNKCREAGFVGAGEGDQRPIQ